MSRRRARISALAKQRAVYADKQLPKLKRAFADVLKDHVKEFAAHIESGGAPKISAKSEKRWAKELAAAQKGPLNFMALHGFILGGDELHGTSHGKSFTGLRSEGKASIAGVDVGDDPTNFLQAADWMNLPKWVATTSESAAATTGTRLQNIFARASAYFDSETNQGRTPKEIAAQILEEGITQCASRAEMLAHNGAIWAYNEGAVQRYAAEGIEVEEWLTADDDLRCPFCADMNGKRISTGDAFFQAGDKFTIEGAGALKIPGGAKGFDVRHPPLHPRCRCTIIPIVDERQLD